MGTGWFRLARPSVLSCGPHLTNVQPPEAYESRWRGLKSFPELAKRLRGSWLRRRCRRVRSPRNDGGAHGDFVVTVIGLPADWRWSIREMGADKVHGAHDLTARNSNTVPIAETTSEPRQPSREE